MNIHDALFTALYRTPDDWVARAALADYYEESGLNTTADCLRWMIAHKIRPSHRLSSGVMWFNGGTPVIEWTDPDAYLPAPLFEALRDGGRGTYMRLYEEPRDAEEDLFAAFAEAVATGWSPRE